MRVVLLAHVVVAGEAAGGQQHPTARADAQLAPAALGDHADHPVVAHDQLHEGALQPDLGGLRQVEVEQLADQGRAPGQRRLPQQRTAEPAHPADVHLGQEPLDRPPGQAQAGHLAVVERQGGRARSDPQLLQPGSEPAPVEDPGLDTASPDAGAGLIRVVVRVPAGPDQTQARPLQERHQLRSGTQERLPTLR